MDRDAFLWVVDHRAGWLDPIFVGLSIVGYAGLLWILLAAGLAAWTGRSVLGLTVMVAACVWSADLVTLPLKVLADRPRPYEVLEEADPLLGATVGTSMPSGHAATSFAGGVLLALVLRRAVPALFALALAVAFSRVYVGVHYPLDVLAGAALGSAVALVSYVLFRLPRRRPGGLLRSEAPPPRG